MKKNKLGLGLKTKIAFILIGFVLIYILFFKSNILEIVFSKNPENFTELYFTNHTELPKEMELKTQYKFKFVVRNLEHKDFVYDYEVTTMENENKVYFAIGQLFLKHGEVKITPVILSLSQPFERTKITVNLLSKGQKIHFWVQPVKKL